MRLHRRFDRPEAAAALLGDGRLCVALEIRTGVRIGGHDVGVDTRCARLGQAGVLAARIDR